MDNKIIAITTDFGDNLASSQLKAVSRSLGFRGDFIENHTVSKFNIVAGAFEIELLSRYCPFGTIYVGVVDPGVGTERAGIVVKTSKSWLVGPNNGLLYPLATKEGIEGVWKLNESAFGDNVTNTFHGRDVFIQAATLLALGKTPVSFGAKKVSAIQIVKLNFKHGQVLHIDDYGNVKVHFDKKKITNGNIKVKTKKELTAIPFVKTFEEVSLGKPLAYIGSSDTLELSVNQGNFAQEFDVNHTDIIEIN